MSEKILISGSVAYDRIMNFPGHFKDQILPNKLHILNVSFFLKSMEESFGGTAGNIAYNLSLLGERPTILANVGKDFTDYKKWLIKNKIDLSQVKIFSKEQTASAYIITDLDDNQIAGFFPGAMFKTVSSPSRIPKSKIAIVSPQNPIDMVRLPEIFKRRKIDYIFDPGQQIASLNGAQLKKAIKGSKMLIGNDYEISLVKKKTGWSTKSILTTTEILITTLGVKGSEVRSKGLVYKIPKVKRKKTVDPTGAGDAYRAGIIKGLINNWPLLKTARTAAVTSVYAVEKQGTQNHKFTKQQFEARYRQNFK